MVWNLKQTNGKKHFIQELAWAKINWWVRITDAEMEWGGGGGRQVQLERLPGPADHTGS